ncbi:MAG TPA: hypothetical protein VK735_42725 [Pseudonocardia sp.]|uniref:hypothetical protein n=1 Tax=Pseudonocardia sp. TaxID=60912 RepID=UPI002B64315A|nr:hypothetical protein [Pseudonocardia sp.]HTF54202.1 hypothetical protein [Pseudonocardia sp.]
MPALGPAGLVIQPGSRGTCTPLTGLDVGEDQAKILLGDLHSDHGWLRQQGGDEVSKGERRRGGVVTGQRTGLTAREPTWWRSAVIYQV